MAPRLPPDLAVAAKQFARGGVAPALRAVRARRAGTSLAQLFTPDLDRRRWASLPEPGERWFELDGDRGLALLAYCRYRSLAYDSPRGAIVEHHAAAQALLDALAVEWIASNSDRHRSIDLARLERERGRGCGWSNFVTQATFEQVVVLVGSRFAALVVWTDED